MKHLSSLCSLLVVLAPGLAHAQSDLDLDETDDRDGARRAARRRDLSQEVVREIERGVYLKSNIGTTFYFGNMRNMLKAGTTLELTLGMDVVDKPGMSVAWEVNFYQALHNSTFTDYSVQRGAGIPANRLIQGDVHTFGGLAGVEVSGYPVRRLGIGGRAGGGVAFVPLLLAKGPNDEFYTDVLGDLGVSELPIHERAHGAIYIGPTLEYYTKLSHFSIGIDADFLYIFGFDYGLRATAYLKYTF